MSLTRSYALANSIEKLGKSIEEINGIYKKVLNAMNFLHTKYEYFEDLEVNNVQVTRSIKSSRKG